MANMIDDMLNNQIPKKPKKGRAAKVIIVLFILLILLCVAAVAVYMYFKNQNQVTPKDLFVQYVGKTNFSNVLNLEKTDNFNTKYQTDDSESEIKIEGEFSNLPESDFDLNDVTIEAKSKNEPSSNKSSSDIVIKYQDNDILDFNMLTSEKGLGLYNEDFLIKHVGSKYQGLPRVINGFLDDNGNLSQMDSELGLIQNLDFKFPKLSDEILKKYVDIINQKVPVEAFTSNGITLDRASGKIDVTEYTMTLSEQQAIELADQLLQALQNDDQLLDEILSVLNDKEGTKETIKSRNS